MSPTWLNELTALWKPPADEGGAEWADAHRVLGDDESSIPGPWRSLGFQRYLLDLFADPSVDWAVILKASQMSISELVRNAIGRWAMLDPGDVLWVMADEKSADKAMDKLRLMFANSPDLRYLLPDGKAVTRSKRRKKDTLKELVLSNGMRIVIGWATSPASLASDMFMRVVLDEVGLYPAKIGKEGSPIGLAEDRTKTYGKRRKIILLSKPTHPDDLICTAHGECLDQRDRHVPCPECGEIVPLEWEGVRWLDSEGCVMSAASAPSDPNLRLLLAAHVEAGQSAWVECEECKAKIVDTRAADDDTRAEWVRVGEGEDVKTRRRGVYISELFHWTRSISDLVVRFLRAIKAADLQNFYTGSLGRPYQQARSDLKPEIYVAKAIHPPGVVAPWATAVIATADTQKDHFWLRIRSHGASFNSRGLDWGRVETFEELKARAFAAFPIEGSGIRVNACVLLIDAGGGTAGGQLDGSRSQEVYRFAATTPHVIAVKGTGFEAGAQEGLPIAWRIIPFGGTPAGQERSGAGHAPRRPRQIKICQPHANYWKDELVTAVRSPGWEEETTCSDPEYGRQMTGQRQVWIETASGKGKWVWVKRRRKHDHLWDCSYLQMVAAEVANVAGRELLLEQAETVGDYGSRKGNEKWQVGR